MAEEPQAPAADSREAPGAPRPAPPPRPAPAGHPRSAHPPEPEDRADGPDRPDGPDRAGCTAPQLRRFIKSRAYVPMHELRRRFAINGQEDDVTPIELDAKARLYVGLPPREGRLLGELLRAGDIGYELSMDPITPVVVGVFPMRPVPRS